MSQHGPYPDPFSPFPTIITAVNIATAVNVGSNDSIASASADQHINVGH